MFPKPKGTPTRLLLVFVLAGWTDVPAQDDPLALKMIEALEKQNALLFQLLQKQQTEIDTLKSWVEQVSNVAEKQTQDIEELIDTSQMTTVVNNHSSIGSAIHISGEAGVIFRAGEANTNFPNEEFGIDEARLFLEAQIASGTYLVSEFELFTREPNNSNLRMGELYLEFEDLIEFGEGAGSLSARLGRLNIPFGEEYQNRGVMDNPLISHSVSDFWGIDEGVEAFGAIGNISYVVAVLNGSHDVLRDYTSDKSVSARLGYDPAPNIHIGGSLMRTGSIDVENEKLTELWFGNGFFRSIGSPETTEFDVELAQLESTFSWNEGRLKLAYGEARYEDNDPTGDNSLDFEFWTMEAQQALSEKLFAAIRYSGMDVDKGYPVAGMGSRGRYFFGPSLVENLRRLSMGISYWPKSEVVLKLDYTKEEGESPNGVKRTDTDIFTAEVGARF